MASYSNQFRLADFGRDCALWPNTPDTQSRHFSFFQIWARENETISETLRESMGRMMDQLTEDQLEQLTQWLAERVDREAVKLSALKRDTEENDERQLQLSFR